LESRRYGNSFPVSVVAITTTRKEAFGTREENAGVYMGNTWSE
jgi:hypothetical protein